MLYDPTPPTPTNLVPADNTAFPESTAEVILSWKDPLSANRLYSVRVTDHTDHGVTNHNGLTTTSVKIAVLPNHAYSWTVHKVVEFVYEINGRDFKTSVSSKKAGGTFRIGDCDAAQIVRVAVPEIIKAGATETAFVLVRNVGSRTWTPEDGYELGSVGPNPNAWTFNKAELNVGSKIQPGQFAGIGWAIKAPQTPGKYHFQWQMRLGEAGWFGQKTTPRYLRVDASTASPPPPLEPGWARRDLRDGSLKRSSGDYIILRGGNYHVFEKNGRAQRKLVKTETKPDGTITETEILLEYEDQLPCPPDSLGAATLKTWPGEPWTDLFTTLRTHDINLLRVFLMNGLGIKDEKADELYPFNLTNTNPRKWKIKTAITNPGVATNWNEAYFARLRAFAEQARDHRVYLQLALFNYYELHDDVWNISIWNPTRSDDLQWGKDNLVNPDGGRRNWFFIEPPVGHGLRKVQEKFVKKVVQTLRGLPNIILEVMNEPHGGSLRTSAKFASEVIGWIIEEGKQPPPPPAPPTPPWRPLISVDAFRQGQDPADRDKSDVDWWSDPASNPRGATHVNNYEEIDIISYHGLTGPPPPDLPFKCDPTQPEPLYQTFYGVDLNSIRARVETFRARHPSKALMMSTDAVRNGAYSHWEDPKAMDRSEGQITTNLNHLGATDYEQVTRSDLEDWAYWCFILANEGHKIHFQNHSNYEATYRRINAAYRSAL